MHNVKETVFRRGVAIAWFSQIIIKLLNGCYAGALLGIQPALFWAADVLHFVGMTVVTIVVLTIKLNLHPRVLGFVPGGPKYD